MDFFLTLQKIKNLKIEIYKFTKDALIMVLIFIINFILIKQ